MLTCLLCIGALAQQAHRPQLAWLGKSHFPTESGARRDATIGDVDNDGDLDVVSVRYLGALDVWANDGSGTFALRSTIVRPLGIAEERLRLADIDGDRDLDLLVASARVNAPNELWVNDGLGGFSRVFGGISPSVRGTRELVSGDVDGDGDVDLLAVAATPQGAVNSLLLNDGTGRFRLAMPLPWSASLANAAALADLDGDGDLDAIIGASTGPNQLLMNDGTGRFTDVSTAQLPSIPPGGVADVRLGDLDGDGDLDAFLMRASPRLLFNDGTGTFRAVAAVRARSSSLQSSALADFDVDGDLDLLLSWDNQNELYLNDGSGAFVTGPPASVPGQGGYTNSIATGDLDGDGTPDLVLSTGLHIVLLLNTASNRFADASRRLYTPMGPWEQYADSGDIDGDGDIDIATAERGMLKIRWNDGFGGFEAVSLTPIAPADWVVDIELFDLDGDRDLDVALALNQSSGQSTTQRLFENDGSGAFFDIGTNRWPVSTDPGYSSFASSDVDGDGDQDLFLAITGAPNRLRLNDGSGSFVDASTGNLPTALDATYAAVFVDVDADGDPDLLEANGGQDRLLLNTNGSFVDATTTHLPASTAPSYGLAPGDADGDGDIDVAVIGREVTLLINDGIGRFAPAPAGSFPAIACGQSGVFFDIDNDGDSDLAITSDYCTFILRNEGGGRFVDATITYIDSDIHRGWAGLAKDFDQDGDTDLFLSSSNRILSNLRRQLDAPFLLRVGRPYRLDIYRRDGPSRTPTVALTFASPRRARVPVPPLGSLGIDPSLATMVDAQVFQRFTSASVPVPNSPSLLGSSFHFQSALIDSSLGILFSNTVSDTVVR